MREKLARRASRAGGSLRGARDRLRRRLLGRRLRSHRHPPAAAVGRALLRAPTAAERAWIDRIEVERTRLERSERILRTPLYDYSLDPGHEHVFEDRLGELCRRASKPPAAAWFLFALVRELRPARCLELGTALGISGSHQGAALTLNGSGRLITVDAAEARVEVAREVFGRLGLDGVVDSRLGRFQDVVPHTLAEDGVGFAFVDGHHDEEATLEYLELIHPALVAPAVVVFDDIGWSAGMERAWRTLREDPRTEVAVEAHGMGICAYRTRLPRSGD